MLTVTSARIRTFFIFYFKGADFHIYAMSHKTRAGQLILGRISLDAINISEIS